VVSREKTKGKVAEGKIWEAKLSVLALKPQGGASPVPAVVDEPGPIQLHLTMGT